MGNIRSSIVFSFAEKYLSLVLSLVGTMVLSRLLTPSDTGVYSLAAVWAGIAQVFRDLGVSQYIIQEKELTRDKIRAVYSVSFATSWSLALIIMLSAVPAARFYGEPRLFDVLSVLAFNFAIIPFGSVTMAYMSRELKFRDISIINLFSSLVSLAVSVGLALAGYGVMSLAWATPAATLTTVIVLVFFRPRGLPWLPGVKELRQVLHFVGFAGGARIVDEIGVAAPDIIIGKQLGMHSVGIYSKALGTVRLFHRTVTNAINPIILPYFSDTLRRQQDLKPVLIKASLYTTVLAWPFFLSLAALAYPVIVVLLGDQWLEAVPVARVMCIAYICHFGGFFLFRHILLANGMAKAVAGIITLSTLLQVVGIFAASFFGLLYVAIVVATVNVINLFSSLRAMKAVLAYSPLELLLNNRKSALVALATAAGATVAGLLAQFGWLPPLPSLMLGGVLGGCGWLASVFAVNHPVTAEVAMVRQKLLARLGRT